MNRKQLSLIVSTIALSALLTACGSAEARKAQQASQTAQATQTSQTQQKAQQEAPAEAKAAFMDVTASDGQVVIDTALLTERPTYINYDVNGTTVQMIGLKASDGTYRLSMNTCQSCSPSPRAYFQEDGDNLVCQNCGNTFTKDSVGSVSGGCNPMNIEHKLEDGKLIVDAAALESFADRFTSWQGPTE